MRWQTETTISRFSFQLNHQKRILLLGSCFAENIGALLSAYKFPVDQNPFGIMYNPLSIHQNVAMLCGNDAYDLSAIENGDGVYFSYDHHSRFSQTTVEAALNGINIALEKARKNFTETQAVFIGLGTSFYWLLHSENRVVNNCHKQPGKLFAQRLASYTEVRSALTEIIHQLNKRLPDVPVVFTVSPVRHLKHGSAGNQRSKAALILAAQELAETIEHVHYFPSYELLLDDLREYRFYAEDLIHPNKAGIAYIWEKFCAALLSEESTALMPKIEKMKKLLAHRPFTESGKTKQLQQIEKLNLSFAGLPISFKQEITAWTAANI